MKKLFAIGVLFLSLALQATETTVLSLNAENGVNGWDGGASIITDDVHLGSAAYIARGRKRLTTSKKIDIDPDNRYRVSLWLKQQGDAPSEIYCGWVCYDKAGKIIPSEAYHRVQGSFTELAAPARKGDNSIVVLNGSKWRKGKVNVVAFNAKKDESDLPNDATAGEVVDVVQEGGAWKIVLSKPLTADYPAGCGVREHLRGGDYFFHIEKLKAGDWKRVQTNWFPGKNLRRAAFVKVVIIANLGNAFKNGSILFDDFEVIEEKTNVVMQ